MNMRDEMFHGPPMQQVLLPLWENVGQNPIAQFMSQLQEIAIELSEKVGKAIKSRFNGGKECAEFFVIDEKNIEIVMARFKLMLGHGKVSHIVIVYSTFGHEAEVFFALGLSIGSVFKRLEEYPN
jgi:hypothetical protein